MLMSKYCKGIALLSFLAIVSGCLKYKESGVCLFPSSPSSGGLTREYLVLKAAEMLCSFLSVRRCGRAAGGKSSLQGEGWTGRDLGGCG